MDLRKLKKLIDLVEESGISELELTEGEEKVRISRGMSGAQMPMYHSHPQQMYAPPPVAAAPAAPAEAEATVRQIGEALMNKFVLPMEVIGLLLTAALIGAVIIAMKEEK